MDEKNDLIKVGKYDLRYNELLSIDIEELDIFRSKGLPAHMVKRKHFNCCLLYTSPSPRDRTRSRMPSSA